MIATKKKMVTKAIALPLALALGACASTPSPRTYDSYAVGQVRRVERGTIESFRWVQVKNDSGVGTVAGAGVGAAAGSTIGNGGADSVIGAIGGAIIGGLIGSSVEKSASTKGAYEYIIRTESGSLVTIVQADQQPLPDGAPVIIVFGADRARVRLDDAAFRQNSQQQQPQNYQDDEGQSGQNYREEPSGHEEENPHH
ncbi:glycine zipper 2TM domain-containing protein [Kordiimonas marina]|uniref:glycine zipper 2TM domain-containing protein n=1 Tax=Kordiimonas marina TaxID=2872312 RepID=UPI001FF59B7B|nr:glycine zipper 2TM domain-containing protein [Kordiimonas marina]MCJ9429204.1 glycine zipper 2TM domain-containing protein [Kordiimonas marina]